MLQQVKRRSVRRAAEAFVATKASAATDEAAMPAAAPPTEQPTLPAPQPATSEPATSQPAAAAPAPRVNIRGAFERRDRNGLSGWITIVGATEIRPLLDIVLDGRTIGQCRAEGNRDDVKASGYGDGRCEFRFDFPPEMTEAEAGRVRVRFSETDLFLDMPEPSPGAIQPAALAARISGSRFGGLWIDRADWIDRLGERHRLGLVSDILAERLYRFVRDGYLVIEQAVPAVVCERINEDLEWLWKNPPATMRMETHEPDGDLRVLVPDIAYRPGRTKLLDLYAFSAAARAAVSAPPVIEFLRAIFEDKPQAFQSLSFWKGSQQPMHKDTAYVRVDGNPLALAATWLALEDIAPGTGELEYFVGSHHAPDYCFGGVSKWMNTAEDDYGAEHDKFLASLHADARQYNHAKSSFLARKGDVLIWHADLAHGGSRVIHPDRTRRSLVTHFCPASTSPFFHRLQKLREMETDTCKFTSQHSDIALAGIVPATAAAA
jgi:Phytanoyl-CoA dioxygenase (PhyH)